MSVGATLIVRGLSKEKGSIGRLSRLRESVRAPETKIFGLAVTV